jgi:hypothetical protein
MALIDFVHKPSFLIPVHLKVDNVDYLKKHLRYDLWTIFTEIGHCDMVLLSALVVLDQIDFHKG